MSVYRTTPFAVAPLKRSGMPRKRPGCPARDRDASTNRSHKQKIANSAVYVTTRPAEAGFSEA
jgi:hypothetical protein